MEWGHTYVLRDAWGPMGKVYIVHITHHIRARKYVPTCNSSAARPFQNGLVQTRWLVSFPDMISTSHEVTFSVLLFE